MMSFRTCVSAPFARCSRNAETEASNAKLLWIKCYSRLEPSEVLFPTSHAFPLFSFFLGIIIFWHAREKGEWSIGAFSSRSPRISPNVAFRSRGECDARRWGKKNKSTNTNRPDMHLRARFDCYWSTRFTHIDILWAEKKSGTSTKETLRMLERSF